MLKEAYETVREATWIFRRTDKGLAKKINKLSKKLADLLAEEREVGLTESIEAKIDITESLLSVFKKIQERRARTSSRRA